MNQKQLHFFATVGQISVHFSSIEFLIGELLDTMISPSDPALAWIVTNKLNIYNKTQRLRDLSKLSRSPGYPYRERIAAAIKRLDRLREDRNLFTHGYWEIEAFDLSQDRVRCLNPRMTMKEEPSRPENEKTLVCLSRMEPREWTIAELRQLALSANQLSLELARIVNAIREAHPLPEGAVEN